MFWMKAFDYYSGALGIVMERGHRWWFSATMATPSIPANN
jgi:hypothetical protein